MQPPHALRPYSITRAPGEVIVARLSERFTLLDAFPLQADLDAIARETGARRFVIDATAIRGIEIFRTELEALRAREERLEFAREGVRMALVCDRELLAGAQQFASISPETRSHALRVFTTADAAMRWVTAAGESAA